jgi:hypothetical protein
MNEIRTRGKGHITQTQNNAEVVHAHVMQSTSGPGQFVSGK